jgi:hypothetical protein
MIGAGLQLLVIVEVSVRCIALGNMVLNSTISVGETEVWMLRERTSSERSISEVSTGTCISANSTDMKSVDRSEEETQRTAVAFVP